MMVSASTREIIMGTDNGQLCEMAVDVKDKMEKYVKLLFELKELPEAFTGLQVQYFVVSFFLIFIPLTSSSKKEKASSNWLTCFLFTPFLI